MQQERSALIRHLPNALSISRIPLLFLTTIALFIKFPYYNTVAEILFSVASITDYLDGKAARHFNVVSTFGVLFDALADKILTIGVFISFIALDIYPPTYVFAILVILSREFLVSGLRMIAAKLGIALAAEKSGKIKTAVQMTAAIVTLAARTFAEFDVPKVVCDTIEFIGQAMFIISSVLAFTSGWTYFKKYGYMLFDDATITTQDSLKKKE